MIWSKAFSARQLLLALFGALVLLFATGGNCAVAQDAPIDNLEDARAAVVRIEAVGTFLDFYEGAQLNVPGFGSGFIIDPSGLVVTNNHVVTGGALYRVYVGGSSRPVNARVVGVSECSDLAVIDLEGDGYPYLAWSTLLPVNGKQVFAAGYPLGEPEYKLTSGKIKSSRESGDSDWASIDHTIWHSARIRPGNSGGPLLDSYGRVLGVNYARATDSAKYFAIPTDVAKPLARTLAAGDDVDSLGINGVVITGEEESGVWISSIASGSPADRLGMRAGDIILTLENLDVGMDGTMLDYCDIIQSHGIDDVMSVEVYRPDSDELLAGQFNGRDLVTVPFDGTGQDPQATNSNTDYSTVSDSSGAVSFDVPDTWTDTRERPWNWDGTVVGWQLIAAPNVDSFLKEWGVPGVAFSWSTVLQSSFTPRQIVRALDLTKDCDDASYDNWEDEQLIGYLAIYFGCPKGMSAVVVSVQDTETDFVYKYEFYAAENEGEALFDRFAGSFEFDDSTLAQGQLNTVVDDGRRIFVTVPAAWGEKESEPVDVDGVIVGSRFDVAVNIKDFKAYWGEPGISIWLYDDLPRADIDHWLDKSELETDCDYDGRHDFESDRLVGKYDQWLNCGGATGTTLRDYALRPKEDPALLVSIGLSSTTPHEVAAADAILDSLSVLGSFTTNGQQVGGHPYITVLAENLNVRSGHGTSSDILAQVTRGTQLEALGQFNNCAWYLVESKEGKKGWVSGDSKYTQLTGACADIPAVSP